MAAPARYCPSCLSATSSSSLLLRRATPTSVPAPFLAASRLQSQRQGQLRTAVQSQNAAKYKRKDTPGTQKKKKASTNYDTPDLSKALRFSLVDAMRYLRAAEVGRSPTSSKYELHIRLKTPRSGAVVRNRLRLPHPIKTDLRICVIAAPDSAAATAARAAGASIVGDDEVIEAVKAGKIEFDRCLCHQDSLEKLQKSGVARILGPRGLMPSVKTGTVVKDVSTSVGEMIGASEYRERLGVVRMAIGQLAFTPEMMQRNIKVFMDGVKRDIAGMSDRIAKDVHEVVLSSTNGPGLSLNGDLRSAGGSITLKDVGGES